MMWPYVVLALVAAARLAELAVAQRNTRRLIADGAVEVGAGHYPALVVLHAAWLASLALSIDATTGIVAGWLALYAVLQIARLWIMLTLGRFWTTRVIVLPHAPLVRHGPYRFLRHPNYLVVVLEI